MANFLYRVLCGFFLGISIFAPGISGSVMAIIMGIYNKLINIVANPFKNLKQNIIYLFPMGIGAAISLVIFVLLFSHLFETYERETYLLFIGLIVGTLPTLWQDTSEGKFKGHFMIGIIAAFTLATVTSILGLNNSEAMTGSVLSVSEYGYLALCGFISGSASLVPGMSISMILIMLGSYESLMYAAKSLDIAVIVIVGGCFVLGMIVFSNVIKFLFNKYKDYANFVVFGFMSGSLLGIFVGLIQSSTDLNIFIGAIMLLIGLVISLIFVALGKNLKGNIEE